MSKSGSKALSKSVDSVVKSVESVVKSFIPKEMNMKHVLLAILVGLLLCMMMSQNVEGFGGTYITSDANSTCSGDSVLVQLVTGDITAGDSNAYETGTTTEYSCIPSSEAQLRTSTTTGSPINSANWSAPISGGGVAGGGVACTPDSGPYLSDGTICNTYCNVPTTITTANSIDASSGVCSSDTNYPIVKNQCSKITGETICGDTVGCNWRLFSGDDSMFSDQQLSDPIHLRGLFNTLMNLAGFSKSGCPGTATNLVATGNVTDAMTTTTLPLITSHTYSSKSLGTAISDTTYSGWLKLKGYTAADPKEGVDIYHDFFFLMFGDKVDVHTPTTPKPKMSALINNSELPQDIKSHLSKIVLGEEKLWDELEQLDASKTLFIKNGGRLIAGYNETSGFVIRNSVSQPTLLPGSKTRVHVGAGCSNSWTGEWDNTVSCDYTDQCISDGERTQAIKAGKVNTVGGFVIPYGDSTIRNYCKLDSCAAKYPECQLDNLINKVTRAGFGNLNRLYSTLF